jgi:predicted amidohydrolase YtcJ
MNRVCRRSSRVFSLGGLLLLTSVLASCAPAGDADLIITGARVWTGTDAAPWAEAVAVQGNTLLEVGDEAAVLAHRGGDTRVVELDGGMVIPGFIDGHTHFNSAGALLLGVNLLDVADEAGLIETVRGAADRMPEGSWIVGGQWGAYEAWAMGSAGAEAGSGTQEVFRPHRSMIDSLTPEHPVLLTRWDRSTLLANSLALELAGAECSWEGVECDARGAMTGRLTPAAASRVSEVRPPKSMEQKLAEARVALADQRQVGITSFHDITPPDMFEVYEALRGAGELTARVYARPYLRQVDEHIAAGMTPGQGDEWIKVGALKGFVDGIMGSSGARFYEPYLHSGERGIWRLDLTTEPGMVPRMIMGDSAGFSLQVHAIGDEGIDTTLTMFEETIEHNGPKDRRHRMIHAQVLRGPETAQRLADLGIIAEINPYHCIDDMRWMEERIGERSRWAYAFKTMQDAGVMLVSGSDWPGTNAALYPANPMLGIYSGVTRQTMGGEPAGGWYPEERVDVETMLRSFTVNSAYAAEEEDIKGKLVPGMLADIAVLDQDIFEIEPSQLQYVKVVMTIVDGNVVYEREGQ